MLISPLPSWTAFDPKAEQRITEICSTVRAKFNDRDIPHTRFDGIQKIFDDLVKLGIKKDSEYGASWCKRLGPGAFFTIWRKIDRLETQCEMRKFDVFNVDEDANSTESLDETLKDAIFYFALLLEKREAKRNMIVQQALEVYKNEPVSAPDIQAIPKNGVITAGDGITSSQVVASGPLTTNQG